MNLYFQQKEAIPITEVANHVPKRNGKKVHYSTIYRWTTKGARGRVLESHLVGGIRYTTVEAVQRFLSDNSTAQNSPTVSAAISETLARDGV